MEDQPRPELFVVNRTLSGSDAVIWLAATGAKEVVYNTLAKVFVTSKPREDGISGLSFSFEGQISKSHDFFYGLKFDLPVKNFRLWVDCCGTTQDIINIKGEERILEIEIKDKLPIWYYFDIRFSYTFDSGDNLSTKFDDTTIYSQFRVLDPLLTVSILYSQESQNDLFNGDRAFSIHPKIVAIATAWNLTNFTTFSRYLDPIYFSTRTNDCGVTVIL